MRSTRPEASARAWADSAGATLPLVETELEIVSRLARVKVTSGGWLRHSTSCHAPTARARSSNNGMRIFIGFTSQYSAFRRTGSNFMKALVLSGGGLFGAWQAGVWSVLEDEFGPDLIVGASIGSVNGYLMACGVSGPELVEMWRDPEFRNFGEFENTLQNLTRRYTLRRPFALTVTDILTMTPRTYRDGEITWRHIAASCAVPPVMPQIYLDGRWYTDGGLLNPLPVWAATELGATEIVGLNVLGTFPSALLGPLVRGFRWVFGHQPELPGEVRLVTREPSERLGGLVETLWGTQGDVERWLARGARDAAGWAGQKPFPL